MVAVSAPSRQTRRDRLLHAADTKHVPLRTITATVALVVIVYLAAKVLYRLRDVIMLMVIAGFIALVLNPQVAALQKWGVHRRGVAVAIVTAWAVAIFAGLAVAFGYPLVNGLTHFANSLPAYLSKAENGRGWVGHIVRHYHLESWVKRNSPKLVSFAESLGRPALALGKGAASIVVALGATFALVVLLLLEGPKVRAWVLAVISPERADRYVRIEGEICRSISGYVLGNTLTSLIAGVVVFVTLSALSVPYAFLWALWVALVDFLPTVGGALAGIPTVLFATAHSLRAGIVTAAVFVVYTQIENHVLNPVVMSRSVKINPLLVMVSILVGADIGDWIGGLFGGFAAALLAIPIAGAIQVIVREFWNATAPTAVGQPEPGVTNGA